MSLSVEDNCLGCPKAHLGVTRGRLVWCGFARSYVRTNPLCVHSGKHVAYAPFQEPTQEVLLK